MGIVAIGYDVGAFFHLNGDDGGHGLDTLNIHFIQLLDPVKNGVQFASEALNVFFLHLDAGEFCNAPHGGLIN
jgi:hypothetical protein